MPRAGGAYYFLDRSLGPLMGTIGELHLPAGALIAIIRRDSKTFVPRASTRIEQGDRLTIIGEPKIVEALHVAYHD